jgi:hypothetical protein
MLQMKDVMKTFMRKVLPALDAEILIYEMTMSTVKVQGPALVGTAEKIQGPASGTAEDKEEDVAMDFSSEDEV